MYEPMFPFHDKDLKRFEAEAVCRAEAVPVRMARPAPVDNFGCYAGILHSFVL